MGSSRVSIPRWGMWWLCRVTNFPVKAPCQSKRSKGVPMSTAMYAVEGMMCESCMTAVLENVHSLSGVTVATMDLVTGGQSPLIVTSGTKLEAGAVRDAVEHVGFGVLPPRARDLLDRGFIGPKNSRETPLPDVAQTQVVPQG
jgi:copper chaperone